MSDADLAQVVKRDASGRIADKQSAAALGRLGGLKSGQRQRLAHDAGLSGNASEGPSRRHREHASKLARQEQRRLAAVVGVLRCPIPVACMVTTAADQRAMCDYLYERGMERGDAKLMAQANKMGNDSVANFREAQRLAEILRDAPAKAPEPQRPPEPPKPGTLEAALGQAQHPLQRVGGMYFEGE
ncbi:MAG: hypothetical protein KC492_32630 [Myxococcales bacterium]|nr:hypothetical protein [Myxococcales bacterium]